MHVNHLQLQITENRNERLNECFAVVAIKITLLKSSFFILYDREIDALVTETREIVNAN